LTNSLPGDENTTSYSRKVTMSDSGLAAVNQTY